MRGLSDAYGSWKTICISLRTSRICRRAKPVMSRPLKMILPAVGSVSLISVRESVVLPQPDSPTSPSVSPAWIERSTPSTAWICPTVRLKIPARIGKYLTRFSTRRISSPLSARSWTARERLGTHATAASENLDLRPISSSEK